MDCGGPGKTDIDTCARKSRVSEATVDRCGPLYSPQGGVLPAPSMPWKPLKTRQNVAVGLLAMSRPMSRRAETSMDRTYTQMDKLILEVFRPATIVGGGRRRFLPLFCSALRVSAVVTTEGLPSGTRWRPQQARRLCGSWGNPLLGAFWGWNAAMINHPNRSKKIAKCKGRQGDWTVEVTIDGNTVNLATAHALFIRAGIDGRLFYDRPVFWVQSSQRSAKWQKFREALLRHKRVVVTEDDWSTDAQGISHAVRTGYVAIYDVTNVIANDIHGLVFELTNRVGEAYAVREMAA